MARIVILSVPAYGHVNPVLPIAQELVRRGHDVTVFNAAQFEPLIAATGATFAPYPPVLTLADFARALKDGDLVAWLHLLLQASGPLLGATYRVLRDSPPDLILFDGVAIWGEMVARKLPGFDQAKLKRAVADFGSVATQKRFMRWLAEFSFR